MRTSIQSGQTKIDTCQLALDELEQIIQGRSVSFVSVEEFQTDPDLNKAFALQANIHEIMGKYQEAYNFATWVLSEPSKTAFSLDLHLLTMLLKGKALLGLGRMQEALESCFELEETKEGQFYVTRIDTECFKFAAQCWYQMVNWQFCHLTSSRAIGQLRYVPGVHKICGLGIPRTRQISDARSSTWPKPCSTNATNARCHGGEYSHVASIPNRTRGKGTHASLSYHFGKAQTGPWPLPQTMGRRSSASDLPTHLLL